MFVAVVLGWTGGCGDDVETTEGPTASGVTTTTGETANTSEGAPTTSADGSSTDGSSTEGSSTAGPVGCGLEGGPGEHFITGTFTLNMAGGIGDAPPTDVFAPLLGVEVCFGLTFAAELVSEEGQQRSLRLTEVVMQTNDSTGVAAATFVPSTTGSLYLRNKELSPNALDVSFVTGAVMAAENFSFGLVCQTPAPFELDEGGLPIFQSMSCANGLATVSRLDADNATSDLASGPVRFELRVP